MHYKNINLKMPSFLWQGNLPNRASKIKRSLARHDIHLPRASGQVLSYTSACPKMSEYLPVIESYQQKMYAVMYNRQ